MKPDWKNSSQLFMLLIITLLIFKPAIGMGANTLKVDSAYCFPTEQVTISIEVINDDPVVSFQVDIPVPPYFSYVPNSIVLNSARKADHIITASVVSNNVLRIISYSPGNLAYNGNSGTIATFRLIASAVQGDFILEANNAILGNSNSQNILTAAVDGNVKVMWPLSVYVTSSSDTICNGDSVYLAASGGGGTGSYAFSWYLNTVLISQQQGMWVNPAETSDYVIEITDGISTINDQVNVYCHPLPLVYAGIDQDICSDQQFYLYGSGQYYTSLLWTGGDGYFSDSSLLNSIYYPGPNDISNQGVSITLTVFGEGNCSSAQDTIYLEIIPAPEVFAGNDTIIHPDSLYLTSSASADYFHLIQWFTKGDGYFENSFALQTLYTPGQTDLQADSVELMLEVRGDEICSTQTDSLVVRFSVFAGVDDLDHGKVRIFPNPASSLREITFKITESGDYIINLYDSFMKRILVKDAGYFSIGNHSLVLDGIKEKSFESGIYFIQIIATEKKESRIEKLLLMNF